MRTSRILLAGGAALVALLVLFVLLKRDTKMPEPSSPSSGEEPQYPSGTKAARPGSGALR